LIFVAWIPLLQVTDHTNNWKKYLGFLFLHMLVWNLLTTWWLANASVAGGISAFVINSVLMSIPWMFYYFSRKYLKGFIGKFSIIAYWMAFEFLHQNWDLSWPWLTLGNGFATHPNWVQWYEFTGTSGGSLWVLLSNLLVFHILKLYSEEGRSVRYLRNAIVWVLLLMLPMLYSFTIKSNLTLRHNKFDVVVVQPNVDPWNVKWEAGKEEAQVQSLVALSQQKIDDKTALVVWPETAVPVALDEASPKTNFFFNPVWELLKRNPKVNLFSGIESFRMFDSRVSRYAIKLRNGSGFYEGYNSAALFDSSEVQIYHKSRLVPGAEVLPWFVSFMAPAFEKFGGTAGGYARDTAPKLLITTNHSFDIAPAVCYESVFGDYLSAFNRKGSSLICIVTNDGWWGNTQGYQQHMNYARLRAIESRKWVARSANTGISCFINPYGKVVQQLPWDTQGAIKQTIAAFVTETFFSKYGDLLSRIFSVFAIILFIIAIVNKIRDRRLVVKQGR